MILILPLEFSGRSVGPLMLSFLSPSSDPELLNVHQLLLCKAQQGKHPLDLQGCGATAFPRVRGETGQCQGGLRPRSSLKIATASVDTHLIASSIQVDMPASTPAPRTLFSESSSPSHLRLVLAMPGPSCMASV